MEDQNSLGNLKYISGGLTGMTAGFCLHPMELIKTRMQMQGVNGAEKKYKSIFDACIKVLRNEGIIGMYQGLGASVLRQATYTTTRIAIYTRLNEKYIEKVNKAPNLIVSMCIGMFAGACGALVGNPTEVVLIRMITDGSLPVNERRNYKGVMNALIRIRKEEGLFKLWRGSAPTMGRSMIVNMTELAVFTHSKLFLMDKFNMKEGMKMHSLAALISGFLTSCVALPIDMVKTRIQNMKISPNAKPEYSGSIDVLIKSVKNEGIFCLWKGFTAYFYRLGPYCIITYTLLEEFNLYYEKYTQKKS